MIIKLIEDQEYNGVSFKKGTEIAVTRSEAKRLCWEGLAVANEDFPCEERQKKAAKKKRKKKPVDPDKIDNKL